MANDMNALFSCENRIALVTGVSRGIGQSMAVALAAAGADIAGVSRSRPDDTRRLVESTGQQFHWIEADMESPASADIIVAETLKQYGKIDILVNNAGIIARAPAEDFVTEQWSSVLTVNLHTAFLLTQQVGRHMLSRGSGKVINIASMLSFQGGKRVAAYAASKHAMAGLTKSLANEWASRGICVNAIAPGYIETDNTEPLRNDPTRYQEILNRIPAGRWGRPEDLQGAVVFLASPASDYMSGHVLCIDGGWMCS